MHNKIARRILVIKSEHRAISHLAKKKTVKSTIGIEIMKYGRQGRI